MAHVAVVTDSVACLSDRARSRLGVGMVGAHLVLDGREYRDSIDLLAEDFYARMGEAISHRTASPPVGEWIEEMQAAVSRGAEAILVVTAAARLTSMYDGAQAAAREIPVPVGVVDSKTAGAGEGLYVRRLAEEALDGATLEQLLARAERRHGAYRFEFVIAGLKRLAHSGRMPATVARLGDAVELKPMLTLGQAGEVRLTGAVRGIGRGMERIERRVQDTFAPGTAGRAVVTHALLDDEAQRLADDLRTQRPDLDVEIALFSPVMGASTGPIIGIAWEDPSVLLTDR